MLADSNTNYRSIWIHGTIDTTNDTPQFSLCMVNKDKGKAIWYTTTRQSLSSSASSSSSSSSSSVSESTTNSNDTNSNPWSIQSHSHTFPQSSIPLTSAVFRSKFISSFSNSGRWWLLGHVTADDLHEERFARDLNHAHHPCRSTTWITALGNRMARDSRLWTTSPTTSTSMSDSKQTEKKWNEVRGVIEQVDDMWERGDVPGMKRLLTMIESEPIYPLSLPASSTFAAAIARCKTEADLNQLLGPNTPGLAQISRGIDEAVLCEAKKAVRLQHDQVKVVEVRPTIIRVGQTV